MKKTITLNVFGIVCVILLIISMMRHVFNAGDIDFHSFLSILQNSPNVSLILPVDITITGNWYPFDFLRDFINMFFDAIEVTIWLGKVTVECLNFIFYYITSLIMFVFPS